MKTYNLWEKITVNDYTAFKNKLRTLKIILNNENFTKEHSFCSKKDFNNFIDFMIKFIDADYIADIDYITTEQFKKHTTIVNMEIVFYQTGTKRVVYKSAFNSDDKMEARLKIFNDLNSINKDDFKKLMNEIRVIFNGDLRWK